MTAKVKWATVFAPTMTSTFARAMELLCQWSRGLGARLAAYRRIALDREALTRMSDRELQDIGIDRTNVDFAAAGGSVRHYPY